MLSNSYYSHPIQELLDLRQQQRTGPQLVQEIRKQADDVLYSFLFELRFIIHICKRLKYELWTCSGQNVRHVHAI